MLKKVNTKNQYSYELLKMWGFSVVFTRIAGLAVISVGVVSVVNSRQLKTVVLSKRTWVTLLNNSHHISYSYPLFQEMKVQVR